MEFERSVKFIGIEEHVMRDGGKYYAITLYDLKAGAVTVNMTETNEALPMFLESQFGDDLVVTFRLVPKEKLYRLAVQAVYHE